MNWGLRSNIGEGNTLEKKEDIKQVLSWSDNCKFHFYVDVDKQWLQFSVSRLRLKKNPSDIREKPNLSTISCVIAH